MASALWAGSPEALMLLTLEKSMVTLDGAKKILGARSKVGPRQDGSQWSMVAHNGVCVGGPS
ncbi:hypothetical protein CsSME_00042254 [Camellia sinensis var. sinensis]